MDNYSAGVTSEGPGTRGLAGAQFQTEYYSAPARSDQPARADGSVVAVVALGS